MPTFPLYTTSPIANASHEVRAPGGYEWWYFDAESNSPDEDFRVVVIFYDGLAFHPGYLRRYVRYLRNPTTQLPPTPRDYPCVHAAVYQRGKRLGQFTTEFRAGELKAASERIEINLGGNAISRDAAGGGYRVFATSSLPTQTPRGRRHPNAGCLELDLKFVPPATAARETPVWQRSLLSSHLHGVGEHRWIIAAPRCEVSGTVRFADPGADVGTDQPPIDFVGRGYHDHHYGTAPIGAGVAQWIWGRVLFDDTVVAACAFHIVRPADTRLQDDVRLVAADQNGTREVTVPGCVTESFTRTGFGLRYPCSLSFGQALKLTRPRVIHSTLFDLRLEYDAVFEGCPGRALCEIAHPGRLRWPILGRIIERSIDRPAR